MLEKDLRYVQAWLHEQSMTFDLLDDTLRDFSNSKTAPNENSALSDAINMYRELETN